MLWPRSNLASPCSARFSAPPEVRDLYDAATDGFLKKNIKGVSTFSLAANTAAVVVVVPARGTITRKGNKRLINEVVVDYASPR